MFDKKIIFIISLLFVLPSIHAIQMLEPIMTDISPNKAIELGTVAPGEYFMISFFLGVDEEYDLITTDNHGSNYLFFENTQKTKESIFTVVRIKENVSGDLQVKIIIKNTATGKTESTYIKMTVATDVISSFVLPYEKESKFGVRKDIPIKIINKSITTKKITISSNLPITWFDSKDAEIEKEVTVVLQPSDSIDVNYSFIPKVIGDKRIQLYIYTDAVPQTGIIQTTTFFNKVLFERNEETVKLFIKKDLTALYAANLYNFPTFALNAIPVYFFNNIIRIASE